MSLVCDKCGNHAPEGADVCSLCGDPLDEEKEEKKRRSFLLQFPLAIVVTATMVLLPVLPLKLWVASELAHNPEGAQELPELGFWIFYILLWVVGFVVARFYKPRGEYDVGDMMGRLSWNPIRAARQRRDRANLVTGCLLMPVHIVTAVWEPIIDAIRNKNKPR